MNDQPQTKQPFSFAYLRHMLAECQRAGYRLSSFEKFDQSCPKTIILRHDVDYTLAGVLDIAEIEAELGATASFLFRVHADSYNLFACGAYVLISRLLAMGHEVGLHFEAMNVGRALGLYPPDLLRKEKAVLEQVVGRKLLTCSEHRNVSNMVHNTPLYHETWDPCDAGFTFYTMADAYFKQMKYLSDTNAQWREGDVLAHLGKHDRFQVLIHSDWWFHRDMLLQGPYHHSRRVSVS